MESKAQYPGQSGTLAAWEVRASAGRTYTAWLTTGEGDSHPIVVRAVCADPGGGQAWPKRAEALGTAELFELYFKDKQRGPVSGPSEADSQDRFTFVWQLSEPGPDDVDVLLPRWVSISIDKATGKLVSYDSLALEADELPEIAFTRDKALEKAVENGAPEDAEVILEYAPRWADGGWEKQPTLFWRVKMLTAEAKAGGDYIFIVAQGNYAGEIADIEEIYVPRLESLPSIDGTSTSSTSEQSSPTPGPSRATGQ